MAIKKVKIINMLLPNFSIGEDEHGNKYRFKGGALGQEVMIKTGKKKAGFLSGKILEIVERSPFEILDTYQDLNQMSGNKFDNFPYAKEIEIKTEIVKDLYSQIDWHEPIRVNPSPVIEGYRNKMEYTFGDEYKGGPLVLGMHKVGKFYEISDYAGGSIARPDFDLIRQYAQEFFRQAGLAHHHKVRHDGELKFFVIRYSFFENKYMLNLVTKTSDKITSDLLDRFVKGLSALNLDGEVASVFHTISNSVADAIVPESVEKIWGEDYLTEKINGLTFRISPFSFFQPNPKGAEFLYNKAVEFAGDIQDKIVFDLYSGTGTISQIFAKRAKKVIGVEIIEEAVEKARENAEINKLDNVEFRANDVLAEIDSLTDAPDIVVVDPPRSGIHNDAITKISQMGAKKIVYISCNPVTQVEDIKLFQEYGYSVEAIEAFDQFPRTGSVESVVSLKLNN